MRNLVLSQHSRVGVSLAAPGHLCVDPITHLIYHVNPQGIQPLSNIGDSGGGEGFLGLAWEDHQIKASAITQADVITATNTICVVTEEGDVITVNIDSHEVETVGSVSAGVYAACWSPDQELLALVTGESNLVVMTSEFDPIADIPLNQEDFGENKFINVGWGKKETQFHGSVGKEAAKKERGSVKSVASWDDHKPRISWRGDGQLFVISHVAHDTHSRCLKIVSREGILQATSEQVEGLEQPLAWKPSGSLIASSRRLPHKLEIILFEKNGLAHGEFSVPFKSDEALVKEVMWNQDSSVLLVWLKPLPTSTEKKLAENIVQLWTISNYHWYLKQELTFTDLNFMCWDNENSHLLHVLTSTDLHRYSWVVDEHISQGSGLRDFAYVAVVDGTKLYMTPFRQSVIPPPMSAYEICFPEPVRSVMFAPPGKVGESSPDNSLGEKIYDQPGCNSNNLCVFHGTDTLTFLTQAAVNEDLNDHGCSINIMAAGGNGFALNMKVHRVAAHHRIVCGLSAENLPDFSQLYNWTWATENTILACCSEEGSNYIVMLELESMGSEAGQVVVTSMLPVEDSVVTIARAPDSSFVALQLVSGALLKLDLLTQVIEPYTLNEDEIIFPSVCKSVQLCPVDDGSQLAPLGLSNWNRLYFGKNQLFANCTSFHIHNNYLLVTTTDHRLQIVPLMGSLFRKLTEGKTSEGGFVASRKIERGARIVTAVPQDTRVVLQMPRGNLEVISPRALAVHTVKHLLNKCKYHQAIDMMRKQRIDLNLLYDHKPSEFLTLVTRFVEDVNNPQWIDLFLANLSEVDVTRSMYSFNYSLDQNQANLSLAAGTKIDTVCTAVREAMVTVDEEGYLLPILTSLVKMTPSQMNVALTKIKNMKDSQNRDFKVSSEEGLRHLLYISDVNELYNVALGTYDFDLVMMIAEKSQKDPKEYLPFLNELRLMEEQYRKYKINVYLKRFKMALECIRKTDDYKEECLQLIRKEKLYREALLVFPPSSDITQLVCETYGNYLMSKNYHSEAAIMFSRANQLEAALSAYQQAGIWRMVLVVGDQLKYDKAMMQNLCLSLVKSLKSKSKYRDAAMIYEYYLKNEEEALACLVKANEWEEALRVAQKYQRKDLIDTHIKPGILEHCEFCMMEIERISSTFKQNTERLVIVREIKHKQHLDLFDENAEGQPDCDLYSDTSTVTGMSLPRTAGSRSGSSTSGKTYRSTKNKRKLERKKYSTKEGSTYEDLGLIAELHELYTSADVMTAGITSLCAMLVTFGFDQQAVCLQKTFANLLSMMERKKNEIWPTETPPTEEVEFGPQLTAEGAVSQVRATGAGKEYSVIALRMKELEPHLRHAPLATRSESWSLHMLKEDW